MPTVCKAILDGSEYRAELKRLVEESVAAKAELARPAAATVTQTVEGSDEVKRAKQEIEDIPAEKKVVVTAEVGGIVRTPEAQPVQTDAPQDQEVTVTAKVEGMGDVQDLAKALDDLPDSVTVPVKVTTPPNPRVPAPQQTPPSPAPPSPGGGGQPARNPLARAFAAIREEINNTNGGAKKFLSTILGAGGAVGIVMAGIVSVVKLAAAALTEMKEEWLAYVQSLQMTADELARVGAELQKKTTEENKALATLRELNSQEALSSTQKDAAAKAVKTLQSSYRGLNIEVDAATGKLKNFDAVNLAIMRRQTQRELRNVEAQISANSRVTGKTQESLQKEGWFKEYLSKAADSYGFGSTKEDSEANQKAADNNLALRQRRAELKKQAKEAEEAYRSQRKAENADLSTAYDESAQAFAQRKSDDAFNAEQNVDLKIANRQQAIKTERGGKKRTDAETTLKSAQADYDKAKNNKDQDGMLSAEKQISLAKQTILDSDEKIYAFEQQIADLRRGQSEAARKLSEQSAFELKYAQFLAAKEFDKAAALKQEYNLKQQNLKLDDVAKKKLLDEEKARKALALKESLKEQAVGLNDQALRQAGQVREADLAKAYRDAEKQKGRKLDDDEKALVGQIAGLTYNLNHNPPPQLGDLSVRTNALTSRGGFSTGAVVPDVENYNKNIANYARQLLDTVQEIKPLLEKLGVVQ